MLWTGHALYGRSKLLVNDSLGHEAGDELICGAAECITATIGKKGQTFRVGGDEFVVFATIKQEKIIEEMAMIAEEYN